MSNFHSVLDRLRQRGYRITPQRELIVEALFHTSSHITAEALFARVQKLTSALNIATIYRTLDMLVAEGLASRSDYLDGQLHYAAELHGAHLHLVCRHCRKSLNVDAALLASVSQQVQDRYAFFPDLNHITLFGECAACRKERATAYEEE